MFSTEDVSITNLFYRKSIDNKKFPLQYFSITKFSVGNVSITINFLLILHFDDERGLLGKL